MLKKCTKCKIEKDSSKFYRSNASWCSTCCIEYRNTKGREKQLKRRYGITIEEYNKLFESQEGKCAICKTHVSELSCNLAVDHDHNLNKVRGLLCYNCNMGLGRLKDNIDNLTQAINYLNSFKDKQHTIHEFPQ